MGADLKLNNKLQLKIYHIEIQLGWKEKKKEDGIPRAKLTGSHTEAVRREMGINIFSTTLQTIKLLIGLKNREDYFFQLMSRFFEFASSEGELAVDKSCRGILHILLPSYIF